MLWMALSGKRSVLQSTLLLVEASAPLTAFGAGAAGEAVDGAAGVGVGTVVDGRAGNTCNVRRGK